MPMTGTGLAGPPRTRSWRRTTARSATTAWIASRALVGAIWLGVALLHPRHVDGTGPARSLLSWDGQWYARIATDGYEDYSALRFFPLLPLVGRAVGALFWDSATIGLLLTANVAALVYLTALAALTQRETGDESAARRVVWLAALAPGAVALALPYTEALAGALAVGMFVALRSRTLWAAAACGFLSGLARPTGILLAAPAAIELLRPDGTGRWTARCLTVASPLLGTAVYLLWCGFSFGDPWIPYTVQTRTDLRGAWLANPVAALLDSGHGGLDWRPTLLLVGVAAALVIVVLRRLPLAYGAWTVLMVAAALTSSHGHSAPRYLAGTFPLIIAAGLVTTSRWVFGVALAAATASCATLTVLGFTSSYVP